MKHGPPRSLEARRPVPGAEALEDPMPIPSNGEAREGPGETSKPGPLEAAPSKVRGKH